MNENVVVVPVHNQLPYLIKCVESVISKTKDLRLIIVDDGSTEKETKTWIETNESILGYKRIYHETALGFTKSCNDAIEYAIENYSFTCLCLLNSDTVIFTPDWFERVKQCFEQGDKIGVASVMSDNALAQTIKHPAFYMAQIDKKPTVYSYFLHGFCYFISRDLILEIGNLDGLMFPHYGSEDDYSLKSLRAGFHNILVGSVFVSHNNATSYTEAQRQVIVSKSFPDLNKRWGRGLVDRCGVMSARAANYINNYNG